MTTSAEDLNLLSLRQTADMLGVSEATIYSWRHRGEGPRGYKIGGLVRYRLSDVLAWVEEHADPSR